MLQPGSHLGSYEIKDVLGAGGMGVVYEATDSRLGRKVALKLLHEAALRDPDRLSRFEREARILASLNQPNIAAIHGLEESDGLKFLVLEHVPGDTLAQRLVRGPLPVKDALEVCRQVADALAAAHEAGVIHRDLKPSNIKITPDGKVKVLDFGLAKAMEKALPVNAAAETATISLDSTQPGVVMGTAPYMSPEQASGKPVDRRTDIWAFGCVLYEALSGTRTFPGGSTSEILVGILDREPRWDSLPAGTPENVKALLRRCLSKDLRTRLHDIADARLELEETLAGRLTAGLTPVHRPVRSDRRVWAGAFAGVALGALAAGLWFWNAGKPAVPARVARFTIDLPAGSRVVPNWGTYVSFSPDSKTVVYPVFVQPPFVTYTRRIDESESHPLDAAKGLGTIWYSPDNRWFWGSDAAKGMLVKVPVGGGAPVPITPFKMPFPGQWGPDGNLYWSDGLFSGVVRTSVETGKTETVTELETAKQERAHRFSRLLPRNGLMFTVAAGDMESFNDARIDVVDLASRKRKTLIRGGACARYSPSGHIVYARGGSLYAVAYDERTREVGGTPVKVVDGVLMSINIGVAYFDISPAGDLAYAVGPVENGERLLYWVDRQGKAEQLPLPARSYLNPRISPDGKLLAVEVEGVNHDFYTYDFARGVMSRITHDGISHAPIWSPDGKRIAFRTWKGGRMNLSWMPADRSGPEESLLDYPAWHSAVSISPDGNYLSVDQMDHGASNIVMLPLTGERKPIPFVHAKAQTGAGKFSPDGKWVVYCSLESGTAEVYVQPWPGPGPKIQISADGGTDPLWRADGKEIFYRKGAKMMSVAVNSGSQFQAGRPQVLWEGDYTHGLTSSCGIKGATNTGYDVSPDGGRFLMIKDRDQGLYATRIVVVLNWVEELKRAMAEADAKRI